MRNGYYLYAYIEINEYANYYKTDTKRHDQNISLWKYSDGDLSLVRYWELERLSRIKHHNKAFSTKEQFIAFINQLLSHFDLDDSKLVGIHAPPYFELIEDRKFQFFWSMFSSYIAQGTYEVKDNEIICKTDDGNNVYTFEILEGEGYKFIESKSSRIPKYKYSGDATESFAPVVDGAIFD